MARKPPSEERGKTRKARRATGNPRAAKNSSGSVDKGTGAAQEGAQAAQPARGVRRGAGGESVGATDQGIQGAQSVQGGSGVERAPSDLRAQGVQSAREVEKASFGAPSPGSSDDPLAWFDVVNDDATNRSQGPRFASAESTELSNSEELGVLPNPSIKTKGQIKRAAKAQEKIKKDHRRKIERRIALAILGLILIALAVLCVMFGIHRWGTYSDEADIQGTWYVEGTDQPIVITADKIELTDGVAYSYKLDPDSKTITFKFGNMTGEGRYRFSLDRQQLSIMDGEYGYWDTLTDDAAWTIQAIIRDLQGLSMLNPGIEGNTISKGTITLFKKPNATSSDGAQEDVGEGTITDALSEGGAHGASGEADAGGKSASGGSADDPDGSGSQGSDSTGGTGSAGGSGVTDSNMLDVKDL